MTSHHAAPRSLLGERTSRAGAPPLFDLCFFCCLCFCATTALSIASTSIAVPPPTRSEPVSDMIHGRKVDDPYRWLEQLEKDSPEVAAWTTLQNDRTTTLLRSLPCHAELTAELRPLMSIGSVGMPVCEGGSAFWTEREGSQNQPVLYVGTDVSAVTARGTPPTAGTAGPALNGPDRAARRTLIDVNALDARGLTSLDWWVPSPCGKRVAFGLSKSGSEMSVLHVLDAVSGRWISDEIAGKVSFGGWTPTSDAFIYSALSDAADPYSREVRWHTIGEHPRHDKLLARQTDPSRIPGASISRDGRWIFLSLSRGWQANDLSVIETDAWQRAGMPAAAAPLAKVVAEGLDATFWPAATVGDTLFMRTTLDAPTGTLVAVALRSPQRSSWKTIVAPRTDMVLEGASRAGDLLVLTFSKDVTTRLERIRTTGEAVGAIELPGLGTAGVGTTDERTSGFVSFTSFNEPRSIYAADFASGAMRLWARPEIPFDPASIEVKQVFVPSKDGTRVPMFIVQRKELKHAGSTPALLYAYGGFNVSLDPAFSPTLWPWLQRGGVYAVANLRGGSEYGEAWHRAGMLGNKQNVFDDFHACAQWLIDQKITDSAHLAIEGGSNGGLLTGVAITQRPDLYTAAISAVPLLDMMRYHQFLLAKYWVPEYGSSEDAAAAEWLSAYSPYHNVRPGTQYPAVLFTAGENDSRVHPLHARKMAAWMQAASASDDRSEPVLLWVDRDAGHGQGKPLARRIEDEADQWSFVFWQTGICGTPTAAH